MGLSWTAPVNGAGYFWIIIVEYKSASGSWTYAFNDGTGASTTASVTGFQRQMDLYVQGCCTKFGIGTGEYSAESNPVTPLVARRCQLVNLNIELAKWNNFTQLEPPTNNGGAAVTGYVVDYKLSSEQDWNVYEDGSNALSTTISR